MNYDLYETKFGTLLIKDDGTSITNITLMKHLPIMDDIHYESALIKLAKQQIDEYFQGKRKTFDLPLNPAGTPFQKQVWHALCNIPYGETRTYKQIAEAIDCPKGYRAVGLANNKNPIVIVIPCHRVIGKNGSLVGYALGLEMKQSLIDLENKNNIKKHQMKI